MHSLHCNMREKYYYTQCDPNHGHLTFLILQYTTKPFLPGQASVYHQQVFRRIYSWKKEGREGGGEGGRQGGREEGRGGEGGSQGGREGGRGEGGTEGGMGEGGGGREEGRKRG